MGIVCGNWQRDAPSCGVEVIGWVTCSVMRVRPCSTRWYAAHMAENLPSPSGIHVSCVDTVLFTPDARKSSTTRTFAARPPGCSMANLGVSGRAGPARLSGMGPESHPKATPLHGFVEARHRMADPFARFARSTFCRLLSGFSFCQSSMEVVAARARTRRVCRGWARRSAFPQKALPPSFCQES